MYWVEERMRRHRRDLSRSCPHSGGGSVRLGDANTRSIDAAIPPGSEDSLRREPGVLLVPRATSGYLLSSLRDEDSNQAPLLDDSRMPTIETRIGVFGVSE